MQRKRSSYNSGALAGNSGHIWRTRCQKDGSGLPEVPGPDEGDRFIEPPQGGVIEKILRHCGLWHCSRAPPAGGDVVHAPGNDWYRQQSEDEPRELAYVDKNTFWREF